MGKLCRYHFPHAQAVFIQVVQQLDKERQLFVLALFEQREHHLAALGVGIATAAAASAIGRNPEAAGAVRGVFIIGAAFAEGLGVLAIVLGILSLVL